MLSLVVNKKRTNTMWKTTLLFLFLITLTLQGQNKIKCDTGMTTFEASIPLFEEVSAVNKKTKCSLITTSSELNCWLYIKDFEFKRKLMQEHFNSGYMESDRYPKAFFKGKIENFNIKTLTTTSSLHQIKGRITIKGKTKKIATLASLKKVGNGVEFSARFNLNTDDFEVEIPFIVRTKISKNVTTEISCVMN